jgi:hypothetical protein
MTSASMNNSQLQGRDIATRILQTIQHVGSLTEAPVLTSGYYSALFAGTLHDPAKVYSHSK